MHFSAFNFENNTPTDRQELNMDEMVEFLTFNPRGWKIARVTATKENGHTKTKVGRVSLVEHVQGKKVYTWDWAEV